MAFGYLGRIGAIGVLVTVATGCSVVGASEVTLVARNDSEDPMVVQVIQGQSAGDAPHGEPRTIPPGVEERVTLPVPGGGWTDFAHGPYWEAPSGWAETGP